MSSNTSSLALEEVEEADPVDPTYIRLVEKRPQIDEQTPPKEEKISIKGKVTVSF